MTAEKKKILLIGVAGVAALLLFTKKSAPASEVLPDQIENEPQSPVFNVPAQVTPLQSYLAVQNREQLIKYSGNNTTWINAYNRMNDLEINASWEYLWSYLLRGLKLYRLPGTTGIYPDGNWNTVLYDQIAAIKAKYGIF